MAHINLNFISSNRDTSGKESAHTHIGESFFRGAEGAVFAFDATNRQSFLNLRRHMRKVEEKAKASRQTANVQTVVVATKADIELREVTTEEGHVFAIENGSRYHEVSAKDPDGAEKVASVFKGLAASVAAARAAEEQMRADAEAAVAAAAASGVKFRQGAERGKAATLTARLASFRRAGSVRKSLKRASAPLRRALSERKDKVNESKRLLNGLLIFVFRRIQIL